VDGEASFCTMETSSSNLMLVWMAAAAAAINFNFNFWKLKKFLSVPNLANSHFLDYFFIGYILI
jgi:hypothetical protein